MAPPIKSNVSIHPRLKAPHLIPALAFSHMLSNLQHPPAICQPCSPPLPKETPLLVCLSPAWLPTGDLLSTIQLSSPHAGELFSTPRNSVVPWKFPPAWGSQLNPSPWCWPLWCPSCGFSPVSSLRVAVTHPCPQGTRGASRGPSAMAMEQ